MSETAQDLYRCTPRQVRSHTIDCIQAGLVPFIRSSPGMGKSSIVKSIGEEFGLEVLDERLSTRSPVDLAGIPHFRDRGGGHQVASFIPFDTFPTVGSVLVKGKDGWLLFLDEFNSAPKSVQAAAYKLILDRMVGLTPLHENVAIVCAGNLDTDRAIVNSLSTAMQSRVVHIEMVINHREWLEDVALKYNYDKRIIGYLNYKKSSLMDFKPDHNDRTFCCPRTWEFMNRLVKDKPITDEKTSLYAGTITSGVAADFVQYSKVYDTLITIRQILADPANADVPMDQATRWAVISHLIENVDEKNFADLAKYVNRFGTEFRVLFGRTIMVRHPKLRHHNDFAKFAVSISKYLHGEDEA